MSELQNLILDTTSRIFGDHIDHALIANWEKGKPAVKLLSDLQGAGIHKLLCSEQKEGAGGNWQDALGVIKLCGSYAAPVPLPDILAAEWLSDRADLRLSGGIIPTWGTISQKGRNLSLDLMGDTAGATHVAGWHAEAEQIMLLDLNGIGTNESASVSGERHINQTIASQDVLETKDISTSDIGSLSPIGLGALLRSAQMLGAMESALRLAVDYANERVQFGRPIGKFQAIQQQLAEMSGHVAAASRAVEVAYETALEPAGLFNIACAKIMSGRAAASCTSVSHQVHGAIGITYEYQLQFLTRRLWAWMNEFGSETYWADQLGALVLQAGADTHWPKITSASFAL